MISFRSYYNQREITICEGAINSKDIFKRGNKLQFIEKSIAGELVDTKGNKIPKIDHNSRLVAYLKLNDLETPEINGLIIDAFGKSLTALAIDKPANGFSISGNSKKTPSGAQWEEIICTAYNMLAKRVTKVEAYKMSGISAWPEWFDDNLSTAKDIVRKAFSDSPGGIMNHYGASSADITKEWDEYFIQTTGKPASGPTKTPKTDMYIGSMHISLKKAGGSQLMSGGKAESLATLAAAYDKIPEKIKTAQFDIAWKKISNQIEKEFLKIDLQPGKSIGYYKSLKADKDKDEVTKTVLEAIRNQKVMGETLRALLESKEAKMEVVREAMTGQQKFATPLAVATHIMVFDTNGAGDFKAIDNSLVSSYANKVKFDITFKSSGVGGISRTALKGYINEDTDQDILANLISETYDECMRQYITENIFAKISSATKQGVLAVKTFLTQFMTRVWGRIKVLISQSFDSMQKILGFKMNASSPTIVF